MRALAFLRYRKKTLRFVPQGLYIIQRLMSTSNRSYHKNHEVGDQTEEYCNN